MKINQTHTHTYTKDGEREKREIKRMEMRVIEQKRVEYVSHFVVYLRLYAMFRANRYPQLILLVASKRIYTTVQGEKKRVILSTCYLLVCQL